MDISEMNEQALFNSREATRRTPGAGHQFKCTCGSAGECAACFLDMCMPALFETRELLRIAEDKLKVEPVATAAIDCLKALQRRISSMMSRFHTEYDTATYEAIMDEIRRAQTAIDSAPVATAGVSDGGRIKALIESLEEVCEILAVKLATDEPSTHPKEDYSSQHPALGRARLALAAMTAANQP